jgi:hypothetical protein
MTGIHDINPIFIRMLIAAAGKHIAIDQWLTWFGLLNNLKREISVHDYLGKEGLVDLVK